MMITLAVSAANPDAGPRGLNRRLFLEVNTFARHTTCLHTPVYLYATYGVLLFGALLVAGWWQARLDGNAAAMAAVVWAPIGTLLALAVSQPIVHAVAEPRPYTSLPHILVLAHRSSDLSFPSDHATMAGAVAAALFLVHRRLGAIAAVAAVLMAFCRVYIAADYPLDVEAGLMLGATTAVVGLVLEGLLVLLVQRLTATPLRPLLTTAPITPPTPAGEDQPVPP